MPFILEEDEDEEEAREEHEGIKLARIEAPGAFLCSFFSAGRARANLFAVRR
jgi:hypothetical protein